jgi:hypothetical protein
MGESPKYKVQKYNEPRGNNFVFFESRTRASTLLILINHEAGKPLRFPE